MNSFKVIIIDYKKYLTVQCRENLNSLSDEYMLEITDASIRDIDELLFSFDNSFFAY